MKKRQIINVRSGDSAAVSMLTRQLQREILRELVRRDLISRNRCDACFRRLGDRP